MWTPRHLGGLAINNFIKVTLTFHMHIQYSKMLHVEKHNIDIHDAYNGSNHDKVYQDCVTCHPLFPVLDSPLKSYHIFILNFI
jgi:hypothetical protein